MKERNTHHTQCINKSQNCKYIYRSTCFHDIEFSTQSFFSVLKTQVTKVSPYSLRTLILLKSPSLRSSLSQSEPILIYTSGLVSVFITRGTLWYSIGFHFRPWVCPCHCLRLGSHLITRTHVVPPSTVLTRQDR